MSCVEEQDGRAVGVPLLSNGERAGDLDWTRADLSWALFYIQPLSQARQLAWGLGRCLHYGVWEADEGGV